MQQARTHRQAVSLVSLLKPSSLGSAGEAIRQIGLGGCDCDSQTLGLDSSLASSADSHSLTSACASKVEGITSMPGVILA